jgi:glycosyltransferase involved in cell wall biosynthesis
MTTRLAILSSHPIQYNAPAFRALAAMPDLDVHVFYGWEGPGRTVDPEFGRKVEWDIPLLDGYDHTFVPNTASDPGSHRFRGIDGPGLTDLISGWTPDALLVYGWAFASHLKAMRAFRGKVPIIFRGDSTLLDERGPLRTLARRLFLRWVYRHVDVALYPGTRNHEYLRACGLREDQLVWAPHAVDNRRFAAAANAKEIEAREWRRQLGISDSDAVFLFPAKLIPRKDPVTLLRAFRCLRRSVPELGAHLVFVGDGGLSAELKAEAAGRTDVHFLGFHNQTVMPVVYRIGDVIVLPSRFGETWGLAINEAMACGRPAIVSDRVGCGVDIVKTGRTGLVFEHGNLIGLCAAMTEMLRDSERRKAMGAEALTLIEEWSIPAYTRIVAELARSVAARNPMIAPSIVTADP